MKEPCELRDAWHLPLPKRSRTREVFDTIDSEIFCNAHSKDDVAKEKLLESYREAAPRTPPSSRCETPLIKRSIYPGTDAAQGNRPYQSVYPSIPDVRWPTEAAPPSPLRLPSLQEFEKGVKDLIKFHGHSTSSPPPSLTPPSSQASPISHFDVFSRSPLNSSPSSSRDHHFYTQQAFSSSPMPSPLVYTSSMDSSLAKFSGYPSPPPDDARHINKKYTTEEGDFIIYALHDKKQKWATITRGFAMQFGNMPDRTTSGLQAWYYRMNLRIPVWDKNGWLVFDNDDDEEPRTVTIKCRHKASEGLGLAQRYPERMVEYDWVDEASKLEAQDWATKRILQLRERRERQKNMALRQIYD